MPKIPPDVIVDAVAVPQTMCTKFCRIFSYIYPIVDYQRRVRHWRRKPLLEHPSHRPGCLSKLSLSIFLPRSQLYPAREVRLLLLNAGVGNEHVLKRQPILHNIQTDVKFRLRPPCSQPFVTDIVPHTDCLRFSHTSVCSVWRNVARVHELFPSELRVGIRLPTPPCLNHSLGILPPRRRCESRAPHDGGFD